MLSVGVPVPLGFVVVLPGSVVVPVVPGNAFGLPGEVLPGVVEVVPDVVSEPVPVVLEPVLDEPTEPLVPVVVLLPMPLLVSVVALLDGLVLEELLELPLRGVVFPERPWGELLREVDVSLLVPVVPEDDVPVVEPVALPLVSCPLLTLPDAPVEPPMVPDVLSELLCPTPELALGVPVVELLDPVVV